MGLLSTGMTVVLFLYVGLGLLTFGIALKNYLTIKD